ncbi:MAG TPA: AsmA family protein [Gammaproteobacteria bacterium]|nr:AsmA family protein [Gammaproteobacteria bacterium]
MGKLLKIFFKLLLILILLAIVGIIGALWYFNPNDYKPQLESLVEKKTGQEVQFGGDISLNLFPWLGFSIENVSLKNPEGFGSPNFITVKSAGLKVETMSLLQGHVNVDRLFLEGATFNLERKQNGIENWTVLLNNLAEKQKPTQQAKPARDKKTSGKPYSVELSTVEIEDATINYVDHKNNQRFLLSKGAFKSSNLQFQKAFPIQGQFTVTSSSHSKDNALTNTTKFSGELQFKPKEQQITLTSFQADIQLQGNNLPHHKIQTHIQSTVIANMQQRTLQFKNMSLDVDNTTTTGSATLHFGDPLKTDFDLRTKKLDLDYYIDAMPKTASLTNKTDTPNAPSLQLVAFTPSTNSGSRPMHLQGTLKADWLKVKHLIAENVNVYMKSQNNGLYLDPIRATLYQGTLNARSSVQLTDQNPIINVSGNANNINMARFLQDAANINQLTGTGNAVFDLSHRPQGLNGSLNLNLLNGYIEGVDVLYYLEQAQSLAKKTTTSRSNTKRTSFTSLTGRILASNNVLSNDDLKLEAPEFYGKGKGTVNLNDQTLHYNIIARLKETAEGTNRYALPLAIALSGPIAHPKVVPDMDAYLKAILEQQVKKQIDKQLNKQLGKILGVDTQTTAPNGEVTAPTTPEGTIEDKIGSEIDKGLKKLLKF